MKSLGLSESTVLSVYSNGSVESSKLGGYNAIKKFQGYELGVYYDKSDDGRWKIISVWRRFRR